MFVAEDAPADAQDHRPVPRDQSGERRLVAFGDEPLQELAFGQAGDRPPVENVLQLLEHGPA